MISFFDFKREYSQLKVEINERIQNVFKNGIYVGGSEVKNFESKFTRYIGTRYMV